MVEDDPDYNCCYETDDTNVNPVRIIRSMKDSNISPVSNEVTGLEMGIPPSLPLPSFRSVIMFRLSLTKTFLVLG